MFLTAAALRYTADPVTKVTILLRGRARIYHGHALYDRYSKTRNELLMSWFTMGGRVVEELVYLDPTLVHLMILKSWQLLS